MARSWNRLKKHNRGQRRRICLGGVMRAGVASAIYKVAGDLCGFGEPAILAVQTARSFMPSSFSKLARFAILFPLFASCKREPTAAPPAPPPPAVTVTTLHAESITLMRELPGRTSPFLVAEVRPQVTGIVQRRLFTEGALVRAGDPLYQIDDAVYQAEHNSARAALARAQSALEIARLNVGLRVIVPNPDHILLPGMYVRAIVATGVRQQAILVPQQEYEIPPRAIAGS